jgi:hypothetical protein
MKIWLIFLAIVMAVSCFSQDHILSVNQKKSPGLDRWDLDRYVWSHGHEKTRGQDKSVIDFDAVENWQGVSGVSISADGKYFAYTVDKGVGVLFTERKLDSLVIQSTETSWHKSFYRGIPGFFSGDSKQYIFLQDGTLCFVPLGEGKAISVKGVKSYKTPSKSNDWIALASGDSSGAVSLFNLKEKTEKKFLGAKNYNFDKSGQWFYSEPLLVDRSSHFRIYNLHTGTERSFSSVAGYLFDAEGHALVIKEVGKSNNNETSTSLSYISLPDGLAKTIWSSTDTTFKINSYSLDGSGKQVIINLSHDGQNSVWYWKQGMDGALLKINQKTKGIDEELIIQETATFTDNGNYIQFSLAPASDVLKPMEDAVQLDIWSSNDTVLQSAQRFLYKETKPFKAVFNLQNNQIVRLENEYEVLYQLKNDYAVLRKKGSRIFRNRFWEKEYNKDSVWIVSLKDGRRHFLFIKNNDEDLWLSPSGNNCLYFDKDKDCHFFTYNLQTGHVKDITPDIPSCLLGYRNPYLRTPEKPNDPRGIAGWIEGGNAVLVYDNYDVWRLDLSGKKPALNLTNGFGRAHKISFSLIDMLGYPNRMPVKGEGLLLLAAFDCRSKYNGFYRVRVDKKQEPELLYMGPCFMQGPGSRMSLGLLGNGMRTVKAANTEAWIVQRQTATDASNYFITNDFKNYKRLTNLQPQKNCNWMTAELLSFKQLDGTETQGILYKPENFDPKKKYPVIISFYAQLSDRLYQYLNPSYIDAPHIFDDPAWMVSQGYLVFIPDIYFIQGQWGPSTVNTINGAARYLSSLPFVDGRHLGATGHSNSGRFGYYLLTHSNSFAAMAVGEGTTNIVGQALNIDLRDGLSQLDWAENNSLGTGLGSLWDNKQTWLDHTSILSAEKVSSPLLLFDDKDYTARGSNGATDAIEMYLSLQRLAKKCWWFHYEDEGHVLSKQKDQKDFTVRYTQYFDHCLKCAPAPRWMCEGVAFKDKGIESKYELDPSGNCGLKDRPCIICEAWNKQYKRNPAMFEKPISEWKLGDDIQKELDKKETKRYNKNMVGEAQRIKENNEKLKGVWKGQPY